MFSIGFRLLNVSRKSLEFIANKTAEDVISMDYGQLNRPPLPSSPARLSHLAGAQRWSCGRRLGSVSTSLKTGWHFGQSFMKPVCSITSLSNSHHSVHSKGCSLHLTRNCAVLMKDTKKKKIRSFCFFTNCHHQILICTLLGNLILFFIFLSLSCLLYDIFIQQPFSDVLLRVKMMLLKSFICIAVLQLKNV